MWEWFDGGGQFPTAGGRALVQGLATYTNVRRFTVSTSETPK